MKHKCVVKGCGQRGQWNYHRGVAYCNRHKDVDIERHGRSARFPHEVNERYIGRLEEGRKVGKPRSWREVRRAKEL
ncbi:MAG: hypothetical protein ACXWP0_00625 [Ktedonobacterales bacterium]